MPPPPTHTHILRSQVFVSEPRNHRISVFTFDEQLLRRDARGVRGKRMCPEGLALNPQGTELFVADGDHSRVCVFASEGLLLRVWGSKGAGLGGLQFPRDVKVSAGGDEVYVSDMDSHRFALMGLYCVCWGREG